MIRIFNAPNRNLKEISEKHFNGLKKLLNQRLKQGVVGVKAKRFFSESKLHEIITGVPNELIKIEKDFLAFCSKNRIICNKKNLGKLFNYKEFSKKSNGKWDAFELSRMLGVNSCPYCNTSKTLTHTFGEERIGRHDFDHFFCKTKHPMLALSFYNLIPVCHECNKIYKRDKIFTTSTHIHPYLESFGEAAKFKHVFTKDSLKKVEDITLEIYKSQKEGKIRRSIGDLKLERRYNHKFYKEKAQLIIQRLERISSPYFKYSMERYVNLNKNDYLIVFETEWDEQKFDQKPYSKFTRDIIEKEDPSFYY